MSEFEELIKACFENKNNRSFKEHFNKLCQTKEVSEIFGICKKRLKNWLENYPIQYDAFKTSIGIVVNSITEENIKGFKDFPYFRKAVIYETIENYEQEAPLEIRREIQIKKRFYKYKKEHPEYENLDDSKILDKFKSKLHVQEISSLDAEKYSNTDSSVSLIETIGSKDRAIDETAEEEEKYEKITQLRTELKNIGIEDDWSIFVIFNICYNDDAYQNLQDLMNKLYERTKDNKVITILPQKISKVKNLIKHIKDKYQNKDIWKRIGRRFSTSMYATIIEYLIAENTINEKESNDKKIKRNNVIKKLSIPELIIDFNKIRNYLQILFLDDDIKDKSSFIKKSQSNISSYEKDIHRILLLFNKKEKIFEIKDELKTYSPNKISKVYEAHTAPNLVSNCLILDVLNKLLSKNKGKSIKLADIIAEIFPPNTNYNKEEINNFRKYNLLKRLNEFKEYGLIEKGNNDSYFLNAKFLTEKQKKILEYVVPFFCGIYPFSSIGHFLANRLNTKDKFEFDSFNIVNVLDDCVTFDLLAAINNNKEVVLNFKDKNEKDKKIKPKEILVDNKKYLLKVIDDKNQEYYLNEVERINGDKPNNLIFSEIYSMYYKIFENMANEYKNNHSDIESIVKKYNHFSSEKDKYDFKRIIKEIVPKLAKLNNISIPLTNLELHWLKTIMQDPRFDLFVSEVEKHCLDKLVDDVEIFDLSAFKVFDYQEKEYKNIVNQNLVKKLAKINKIEFKKQLSELNSIIYSQKDNSFKKA